MKDQAKQLLKKLNPALMFIQTHSVLIAIVVLLLVVTSMFIRINQLSSAAPTQAQIDKQSKSLVQPNIDPRLLTRIQQLQNNNINVQTLFEQARNNPFSE